ncbi:hypothetical protein [Sanguibacter sp. Leaf3]|uniref:hypothetical protein n=1 Tax=Sanguibacter sp. Leaf3 TaxID=1736209 RepID=UPI0006F8E686|nr:hypothetical protein [Sanguibacter sp. Leaf3]KQT99785.1 hypothetical protein ASG53_02840 [Sanguibacter sp. Leaf3]
MRLDLLPARQRPDQGQHDRPTPLVVPRVVIPDVVLARDLPRGTLDAEVRDGRLVRVGRGAYVSCDGTSPTETADGRRRLELARIAAVVAQTRAAGVVSHQSAALVWGLPTWHLPTTVHLFHPVRRSSRSAGDITWHEAGSGGRPTLQLSGLCITNLEQTVVDCLRTAPPLDALVITDAALARGADRGEIERLLTSVSGRRGASRGRELLDLADAGAQSPWESVCRVVLQAVGLPAPETQVQVDTYLGRFYADLGWRQWRFLVEFDGATKYSGDDRAATSALMAEKRRQHAVEDEGWRVLRATAADLGRSLLLVQRLRRLLPEPAFRSSRPRPHLLTDLHHAPS